MSHGRGCSELLGSGDFNNRRRRIDRHRRSHRLEILGRTAEQPAFDSHRFAIKRRPLRFAIGNRTLGGRTGNNNIVIVAADSKLTVVFHILVHSLIFQGRCDIGRDSRAVHHLGSRRVIAARAGLGDRKTLLAELNDAIPQFGRSLNGNGIVNSYRRSLAKERQHDTRRIADQDTLRVHGYDRSGDLVVLAGSGCDSLGNRTLRIIHRRNDEFRTVTALVKFEVIETQTLVAVNIASGKGIIAETYRNLVRRSGCRQFELGRADRPVARTDFFSRKCNGRIGRAAIGTYSEFHRRSVDFRRNRSIADVFFLIQCSERKREIAVSPDIDILNLEYGRSFAEIDIGSARNLGLLVVGRLISRTAVTNRSVGAGIGDGLLIERTAAGPTFELVHIRPVAIDFLDLRAAVLAVKSVTRRNIAVALYDRDRSLVRKREALDRGAGGQNKDCAALSRSLTQREGKLRRTGLARHRAGSNPLRIPGVLECQGPVAFRNDLDRLFELAALEFPGDSHRLAAVHGNFGHARITALFVIVRTCAKSRHGQRCTEQCLPKIYYFHRVEC